MRGTLRTVRSLLYLAIASWVGACGFQIAGGQPSVDGGRDGSASDDGSIGTDVPIDETTGTPVRRITIAGRGETLAGFPVWIDLTDTALATESGTATPYFTRTDGTGIAFQIQAWSASSGRLQAWVRADLDATAGAVFDLHAGTSNGAQPSPAAVFAAPFLAVWHFDATTGNLFGDARNVNNGTAVGNSNGLPAAATGKLGSGVVFDGDDDEVRITNPFAGDTSHTFSAWVSSTTTSGNGTIVTVGDPSGDHARWFHTRFPNLSAGFYNGNDFKPSTTQIPAGFHLVHWVYDKGTTRLSRLYIDGALAATSNGFTAPNNTQTTAGHIGNAPGGFGASAFEGVLDEVRLVDAIRTTAWIAAEYANQSAPSSFYSVAAAVE